MKPLDQYRDAILVIAARYGATNVRVFGSVARGDARPDSDVDLLVDLEKPWSLFDHINFKHEVEDLLGCKVDIVVASALREIVREQVFEKAIPL